MSFRPVRKITGIGNVFLEEELVDIAEYDLEIYEENPEAHEHHGADWTPGVKKIEGTVVGAFPVAIYEEKTVRLEQGDVLLAYTDGIVEPENVYGEMFGEDRLKDLLVKYARADSAELIARTMEAVVQWTGEGELQDDMTMVVARRL